MLNIRPVQTIYKNAGGVTGTTLNYPNLVVQGNLKLCAVGASNGAANALSAVTVSDNIDGGYDNVVFRQGSPTDVLIAAHHNAVAGNTQLSVAGAAPGAGNITVFLMEWSGCSKTFSSVSSNTFGGTSATPTAGGVSLPQFISGNTGVFVTAISLAAQETLMIAPTDSFGFPQGGFQFVPGSPTNDVFACIYQIITFRSALSLNGQSTSWGLGAFNLGGSTTWAMCSAQYQADPVGRTTGIEFRPTTMKKTGEPFGLPIEAPS